MTMFHDFGIIDAAGQTFIMKGYYGKDDRDPRFILPREVIERANIVYNITLDEIYKSRWTRLDSEDALAIVRGIFSAVAKSTLTLKAQYDGTSYGSRTHRSI